MRLPGTTTYYYMSSGNPASRAPCLLQLVLNVGKGKPPSHNNTIPRYFVLGVVNAKRTEMEKNRVLPLPILWMDHSRYCLARLMLHAAL